MKEQRPGMRPLCGIAAAVAALATGAVRAVTISETDRGEMALSEKRLPRFGVEAAVYRAEVFGDGSLRVVVGNDEVVKDCVLMQGDQRLVLGNLQREGDTITLLLGEAKQDDMESLLDVEEKGPGPNPGELPGLALTFGGATIHMKPVHLAKGSAKEGWSNANMLYLALGSDAVGVRDLRNGTEDALPTRRLHGPHPFSFYGHMGNYWPDVCVNSGLGAGLTVRGVTGLDTASSRSRLPDTVRKQAHRGFLVFANVGEPDAFTLEFSPVPARSARLVGIAPCTVTPTWKRGMFPENERVLYRLEFDKTLVEPGPCRVTWRLEDHVQNEVATGETTFKVSADALVHQVDLAPPSMGYFRTSLSIRRADLPSAVRTKEFAFARIRPETNLYDDEKGIDGDAYWANFLGFRGLRMTGDIASVWARFRNADNPERIDWDRYHEAMAPLMEFFRKGSVRTVVHLMDGSPPNAWHEIDAAFRDSPAKDGQSDDWQVRRDAAVFGWRSEWAAEAAKLGIAHWEPRNEPDLGMKPDAYVRDVLAPKSAAIRAGNPNANVLGGSCCGLDKHEWARTLYEADGGGKDFDGISFHPYTGLGFMRLYRMHLARWQRLFKEFGDDAAQGLFMTESANHRGWGYDAYVYDRFKARRESHAHTGLHMMLNAEAMGIPRDRVYVFYMQQHGYNDFYLMRYREPTPSAVAFQVMNETLRDARFVQQVPLPGHDHVFLLFRDKERTVAAVFTGGDPLTLPVRTDAASVVVTDLMGNRRAETPVNGVVTVTATQMPLYISVGPDDNLQPDLEGLQVRPNLALSALGASAKLSENPPAPPAKDGKSPPPPPSPDVLIDGDWSGGVAGKWSESSTGTDRWPDTVEVVLPESATVSHVVVYHEYGAWERTLRDFDVQITANGQWETVDEVRGNYYSEVTRHDFEPVATDRVRVVVHAVNACLFGKIDWIRKQTALRAIEVYAAPERPAQVFFAQMPLAVLEAATGTSVSLSYRVVNVTDRPFAGELRLQLPESVTGPTDIPVTVAPRDETTVDISVAVAAAAATGLHTISAGVFRDDALVSSGRALRWLKTAPR